MEKTATKTDYQAQPNEFLAKTKTTMRVKYLRNGKHFAEDKDSRDIYRITFSRGELGVNFKEWSFNFGQSIANSGRKQEPTAYDVLACLTKQGFSDFEDFCEAFGYDIDSKRAEKTYKAVQKEFDGVCSIWNDAEIEQMQEIA